MASGQAPKARNSKAQGASPGAGMRKSKSPPEELDLGGCLRNAWLHFNESCIVEGEALGVRRLDAAFSAQADRTIT